MRMVYMRELKLYECEICRTQYASEKAAIDCEQSHRKIVKVKASKYRSQKSNPMGYPDRITVEFDNRREVIYTKDSELRKDSEL
jgi:hypothetical protein